MGKISKLLGVPQVMECPQCGTPLEPKRTLGAKLWGVGTVAAAGALATVTAGLGAVLGAEAVREYVCDKKGIYYKCLKCGFEYSEAKLEKEMQERTHAAEQAMMDGRSQRLREEEG